MCVWLIDKFAIGCWPIWPQRLIRFYPAAVSLLLILPAHYVRERKSPQSHNNSNKSSGKVWGSGGKGGGGEGGEEGRLHWALHYFCENLLNMPNTQRCMQSGKPNQATKRPTNHFPPRLATFPPHFLLLAPTSAIHESHPTRQTQPS